MVRHVLMDGVIGEARESVGGGINLDFGFVRFAERDHAAGDALEFRESEASAIFGERRGAEHRSRRCLRCF